MCIICLSYAHNMLINIASSDRFKTDLKLALKIGYRIELLEEVVNKLAGGIVLELELIVIYFNKNRCGSLPASV